MVCIAGVAGGGGRVAGEEVVVVDSYKGAQRQSGCGESSLAFVAVREGGGGM